MIIIGGVLAAVVLLCADVFLVLIFVGYLISTPVPPEDQTRSTMFGIGRHVHLYVAAHGRLPESLDQLAGIKDMWGGSYYNPDKDARDGWGRPILYRPVSGERILLLSYGRDGKPAGVGRDADIQRIFAITRDGYEQLHDVSETRAPPDSGAGSHAP